MADVVLPVLPAENEDPWYAKRQAFDIAVKGQIEGPLSESGLNSVYSKLGGGSTQRLLSILKNGSRDSGMLVVGDSTGNETREWVYLLTQSLASDFPKVTVKYRLWNDTIGYYDAAETIAIGTGPRTLTVWNAAIPGATVPTWMGARGNAAMSNLNVDLAMVSMGHNEVTGGTDEVWYSRYIMLTESIAVLNPKAEIICVLQNPSPFNTDQEKRADVYREIATRRGYGIIDVGQAFIDTGDPNGLTDGSVHPDAAGIALWLKTVKKSFVFNVDVPLPTQSPSPLGQSSKNLLLNGDFSVFSAAMPENWKGTNVTAVRDTSNYESSSVTRLDGSEVAGDSKAINFTATGGFQGDITQYIPTPIVRGQWVTLAVRMRVPTGSATTVGRVGVVGGLTGGGSFSTLHPTGIVGEAGFSWAIVSKLIPIDASSCRALIYIDSSTGGGNCTIDRVVMVIGKVPFGF